MNITHRDKDDIRILDIKDKIEIGRGDVALRESILKSLDDNQRKIVLNLAKVSYIDSAGVGELTRSYTTVSNAGGKLVLLNLTKKSRDLLTLTKLISVFDVYNDEQEAISDLQNV